MCVSVHVWLHTSVSVHVLNTHVYMFMCVNVHVSVHVLNTRVHVYECMCVNAHVSVHVCKWEE